MSYCLSRCMSPDGILSCLAVVVDRSLVVPPYLEVHCQFHCDLCDSLGVRGFLAGANPLMEPDSLSCRYSFRHHLLIQSVDKAITSTNRSVWPFLNPGCPNKLAFRRQAGTPFFNSFNCLFESGSYCCHGELCSRDAGGF